MSAPAFQAVAAPLSDRPLVIAVAGNPNAGKSTLINAIAGTRLHVGNWPGVTVEKKEAEFEHAGHAIRLVDLPGTYSLSPYSEEERVAREFLLGERPDVVVNVVDATNLERNLYLTIQLLELGIPVVLALNVFDEAEAKGYRIDVPGMAERLGCAVIPAAATKKRGLTELLDAALAAAGKPASPRIRHRPEVEAAIAALAAGREDEELEALVADARYGFASGLAREVLQKPAIRKTDLTERIDKIVLNRFLGIPIFLGAMWLVFKLTFDLSAPFGDWIDAITNGPLKRWTAAILGAIGAPDWTVSLVNDGVIAGVGFVLVFVPVIFAMMFFITFLEGSGYMARAAFVMDRAMHAIGLHGKSFIPMLLGFGCNVPGIYATRTLETTRDRVLTALLVPLMSCGARLPVYVLFAGVFFPSNSGTVIWSLYVAGIVCAIGMGFLFKRTLFRGEAPAFIMELPPYRMPSFRNVCVHTWEKGKHFLYKAGTYILAVSVLVWFLLNLPWGVEQKQDSYLGRAGQVLAPALAPLGFGTWEAASSLVTGVIAKEIVVGTMGEIYAPPQEEAAADEPVPTLGEDLVEIVTSFGTAVKEAAANAVGTFGISTLSTEEEEDLSPLKAAIQERFSPLQAYAFMIFVLLYMPCVVVAIAMRQEFGGWKWFGVAFVYQTALAWTAAFVVYQGGRLLGLGG